MSCATFYVVCNPNEGYENVRNNAHNITSLFASLTLMNIRCEKSIVGSSSHEETWAERVEGVKESVLAKQQRCLRNDRMKWCQTEGMKIVCKEIKVCK